MKKLVCTILNVDHGFAAFVSSPNGYGLLVDAGSRPGFSPVKWIRANYHDHLTLFEGRRIAMAIITHLHADHFDDVGSFKGYEDPKILVRDKQTMRFLDKKIEEGDQDRTEVIRIFKAFSKKFTETVDAEPDWGFDFFKYKQISYESADAVSTSEDKIINNRSFITGITFAGRKMLFPGDIEVEGWRKALELESVREVVADTSFFIASHHGHKSGFSSEILKHSGRPFLYIVSAKSGDQHIDTSYSQEENSTGFPVEGRNDLAHMVSTREKKASVQITIYENGHSTVRFVDAKDNLNENQKRLRARRTKQKTRGWG